MTNKIPTADLSSIAASALHEVLSTRFNLSAVPASPDEIARTADVSRWLTGSVNLDGARMSGSLHIQLPEAWVHKINASLLGRSDAIVTDEDDALDLTGELCNMIAGRVAASLVGAGYVSTLSTPAVLRGRIMEVERGEGGELFRSDWTCEGHLIKLTLFFNPKLE